MIKILGSLPAGTVGERNAYSKVDEGEKKRKLGSTNLKKQSIPDLFSKINGNILVTIVLKGQGFNFTAKQSGLLKTIPLKHQCI